MALSEANKQTYAQKINLCSNINFTAAQPFTDLLDIHGLNRIKNTRIGCPTQKLCQQPEK